MSYRSQSRKSKEVQLTKQARMTENIDQGTKTGTSIAAARATTAQLLNDRNPLSTAVNNSRGIAGQSEL
jgi:hypothetical protein